MTSRARTRWITAAKAVVTLILVSVVLTRIPLGALTTRLRSIRAVDVLVLFATATVVTLLHVTRWKRLLSAVGEDVGFVALFREVCIGNLYNLALPGGVGGDVVRAVRTGRLLRHPHHAWSTSLFERIVGLFAIAGWASVAMLIGARDVFGDLPSWLRTATLGLTATLALGLMLASLPFRVALRLLGSRLPDAAAAHIAGVGNDLRGPLARTSVRLEAIAWSVVYQGGSVLYVVFAATALRAPGHEWAIVVGVPIVTVLSVLPVTIGGLGLREGLFVGVLSALDVPSEVGLGVAAAVLASILLFALLGLGFVLTDRAKQSPTDRAATITEAPDE